METVIVRVNVLLGAAPSFTTNDTVLINVEGLMQGIDRDAISRVRHATTRAVTAAGGVTSDEDVAWLDSIRVDAVAGMAIYTGRLKI